MVAYLTNGYYTTADKFAFATERSDGKPFVVAIDEDDAAFGIPYGMIEQIVADFGQRIRRPFMALEDVANAEPNPILV